MSQFHETSRSLRWFPVRSALQLDLPVTPITDILIHDRALVLSTNGRSFWILDDITPLRELAIQSIWRPHLFTPRDVYRVATSAEEADQPYVGAACCVGNPRDIYGRARIERHRLGQEPPDGAILYASFPSPPSQPVRLTILDANGKLLRSLVDTSQTTTPAEMSPIRTGLNRYVWDLRVEPEQPGAHPTNLGVPKAVPGVYQVRLTVGGQSQSATFRLMADPRLHGVTQADFQEQFDFLMRIENSPGEIRRAEKTLGQERRRLGSSAGKESASKRIAQIAALESQLARGPAGMRFGPAAPPLLFEFTNLYKFVAGSEDEPIASAIERWQDLKKILDVRLAEENALIRNAAAAQQP